MGLSPPVLTDGRVTLRGHVEEDVPAVLEQSTDPVSVRWTRVPVPYTLDDARRFVRHAMPGGWATDTEWAFAVEAEGRYAGTVSLRDNGSGRAEIAYGAHPWARGRGYVDAALRLLLEWGFAERGLETVVWWAETGNWSSRKAAWRVGFGCDGTVRRWLEERDGLVDCWIGTLTRDDPREPRSPWLDVPRIAGDGIVLREHLEDDLTRVQEACSDERTAYWLGRMPQPYSADAAAAFLLHRGEGMARGTDLHWMIADGEDDRLLGTVSLMHLDSESGAEVGFWSHPDARGRGVMTEAVRLAVRHAVVDTEDGGLGLTKLRLVSAVDNTASRHVAVANGFREVGVERAAAWCRDGVHDAVIHDLLASDLLQG